MKKVLLASSALVLSTGTAFAEAHTGVSVALGAVMGVKYSEGASQEFTTHVEIDADIIGAGETDNGLTFGASLDVDEGGVADPEVFIGGAFGTLTLGAVDPATDGFGIADVGFDGIGVDDDAESIKAAGGGADVHLSVTFGDFTLIAAADTSDDADQDLASVGADGVIDEDDNDVQINDDFSVALMGDVGDFSFGIGYAAGNAAVDGVAVAGVKSETVTAKFGASIGDVAFNAYWADWSTEGLAGQGATAYGIDATYTMGALAVTVAAGSLDSSNGGAALLGTATDADDGAAADNLGLGVLNLTDGENIGIGIAYDLGGGASFKAGVGDVDGSTKADAGFTFTF